MSVADMIFGSTQQGVDDKIAVALEDYAELHRQQAELSDKMAAVKGEIFDRMTSTGISKYEDENGSISIIDGGKRETYPKSALDAIAKQNRQLERILQKIVVVSEVSDSLRITLRRKT